MENATQVLFPLSFCSSVGQCVSLPAENGLAYAKLKLQTRDQNVATLKLLSMVLFA